MLQDNIVRLRKLHGYTQVSLANALHVTQAAVSHWETGRTAPDTQQLFQIASLFGLTVEELSGDTFSPTFSVPSEKTITVPAKAALQSLSSVPKPAEHSPEAQAVIDEIMAKVRAIPDDAKIQVLNFADFIKAQEDAKR